MRHSVHVCASCHLLVRSCCYASYTAFSCRLVQHGACFCFCFCLICQGPPIMRNAWRTQTMCSQCGQPAAKPTPIWSPEILSDVVSDKRASLLTQPDGGLVPTPVLWPQHADSTPPVLYCGRIYLAHYRQQLHIHTRTCRLVSASFPTRWRSISRKWSKETLTYVGCSVSTPCKF